MSDQFVGRASLAPAAFTSEDVQFETFWSLAEAPAVPLGSRDAAPAVLDVALVELSVSTLSSPDDGGVLDVVVPDVSLEGV